MSGIIGKTVIEEIRSRNDIVDVVGAYVQLKRAGSGMKGLCPFHQEKTPSFTVNQQRQIFHCFGCSKGGDVFAFIRDVEHVDFPTAVRILGEKVGVQIEYDGGGASEKGPAKDKIFSLLAQVTEHFQTCLNEPAGQAARVYLNERALTGSPAENFQIGYAPNRPGGLTAWAKQRGFDQDILLVAGMIAESDRGPGTYERFRDRLMFPIRDELGRVIGFSGRIMDPTQKAAKYVNSPETPVFRKSKVLFALDKAKSEILERRLALVCEGQIDVIRCHEAGIHHAVAGQGTALTHEHAKLLHRMADEVVLVLDSDSAGQNAAIRSAEVFLGEGLAVGIAALPPGEDPDSLILNHGVEAFQAVVDEAKSVIDYQVDILSDRDNIQTEAGQARAAKAVLQTIRHADTAVQREHMLQRASARLGISQEALQQDFARDNRFASRQLRTATNETPIPAVKTVHPREEVDFIALLLHSPKAVQTAKHYLPTEHLTDETCRLLADALYTRADTDDLNVNMVLSGSNDECQRLAAKLQMSQTKVLGREFTAEEAIQGMIIKIWRKALDRHRTEVRRKTTSAKGAEKERLTHESLQLTEDLSRLRQGWDQALPVIEP